MKWKYLFHFNQRHDKNHIFVIWCRNHWIKKKAMWQVVQIKVIIYISIIWFTSFLRHLRSNMTRNVSNVASHALVHVRSHASHGTLACDGAERQRPPLVRTQCIVTVHFLCRVLVRWRSIQTELWIIRASILIWLLRRLMISYLHLLHLFFEWPEIAVESLRSLETYFDRIRKQNMLHQISINIYIYIYIRNRFYIIIIFEYPDKKNINIDWYYNHEKMIF